MTRAERAAQKEATLRAKREVLQRALAQAQSQVRSVERDEARKRQAHLGKLLSDSGFPDIDDDQCVKLFAALSQSLHGDENRWRTGKAIAALVALKTEECQQTSLAQLRADYARVQ